VNLNKKLILHIILSLIALIYLLPFWTVFTTAFKDSVEVRTSIPIVPPSNPTIDAFMKGSSEMLRGIMNSLIFTSLATIFSSMIGSVNGFVLSKIRFKYCDTIFLLLTLGIFIPYHAIIIPLIAVMRGIGLFNNLLGLAIIHTIYGIPICTLIFRNFYGEIPESIINAAKVDGARTTTIYRKVVLPLSWPAFVVSGVFQFTSIWNDLLFGLILTRGANQPASVVLANLLGTTAAEWNVQMAGTFMYAFPVIVVYVLLSKYLIRGYLAGAVKG
jgi:glucose/mannose transport system permease protein